MAPLGLRRFRTNFPNLDMAPTVNHMTGILLNVTWSRSRTNFGHRYDPSKPGLRAILTKLRIRVLPTRHVYDQVRVTYNFPFSCLFLVALPPELRLCERNQHELMTKLTTQQKKCQKKSSVYSTKQQFWHFI